MKKVKFLKLFLTSNGVKHAKGKTKVVTDRAADFLERNKYATVMGDAAAEDIAADQSKSQDEAEKAKEDKEATDRKTK